MSSARRLAADVLGRVWNQDAFAAAVLSSELSRHPRLDARDKALATELVYGVLRTEGALLEALSRHGRIKKKDTELVAHLLIGAYQLAFLDRVPERAAVHQAVDEVRRLRGTKVAGFSNALLRKLAAEGRRPFRDAVLSSAPSWLVESLQAAVGGEETAALLGARETVPGLGVRVRLGASPPTWLLDERAALSSKLTPRAYRYRGGGDPRALPGFEEGTFVVQEEGAQLVAWALGARPEERVLDACAGRGQKASLLAELVGKSGELWAADRHSGKLEQLEAEFRRLELPPPRTAVVDWLDMDARATVPEGFDRVLVDVPCSGDGTLRRRPEILRRLVPHDPGRLTEVQAAILRAAAQKARIGGRVVYATCSVLREACEAVITQVGDCLEPCGFDAPDVASVFPGDVCAQRLLPGKHGTDGYFIASFVRR